MQPNQNWKGNLHVSATVVCKSTNPEETEMRCSNSNEIDLDVLMQMWFGKGKRKVGRSPHFALSF